jgi:chromatin assembly factor 1 subunit B
MPALPAIRALPSPSTATLASVKLYGDESFTNFFRRLTFSPDGGLLLTPAGQFEDPAVIPASSGSSSSKGDETPSRGRKRLSINTTSDITDPTSASSVFIYSRANFARPPVAQLPGHKKASVAVRFSPVLYELRQGVAGGACPTGGETVAETKAGVLEKDVEGSMDVDIAGTIAQSTSTQDKDSASIPQVAAPAPVLGRSYTTPSPALSPTDLLRPPTPAASKPSTPVPHSHNSYGNSTTGSVFALPYRMLFAVVTMDTVAIYDTQQAGPVCMLTKLHYDEFTDMTW